VNGLLEQGPLLGLLGHLTSLQQALSNGASVALQSHEVYDLSFSGPGGFGRTPWLGDRPIAKHLPAYRSIAMQLPTQDIMNIQTNVHTSVPRAGTGLFEKYRELNCSIGARL
jgi:hypothetical protein